MRSLLQSRRLKPAFDLTGKKALVTGASRGIGREIALALGTAGADVAFNYVGSAASAEAAAAQLRVGGRTAVALQGDVSDGRSVQAMVQAAVEKLGGLDVVVNNAGILQAEPFLEMKESTWDRVLDVNLKGQFLVAQAAARQMVKQGRGGRIINIASIASGQIGIGYPGCAHYTASKGGVIALTETIALELGPHKITCNAIAPGLIETDMTKDVLRGARTAQAVLARIPLRRAGRPADVAPMAVFLASDEADYCTGSVFYVDGGWLAG